MEETDYISSIYFQSQYCYSVCFPTYLSLDDNVLHGDWKKRREVKHSCRDEYVCADWGQFPSDRSKFPSGLNHPPRVEKGYVHNLTIVQKSRDHLIYSLGYCNSLQPIHTVSALISLQSVLNTTAEWSCLGRSCHSTQAHQWLPILVKGGAKQF